MRGPEIIARVRAHVVHYRFRYSIVSAVAIVCGAICIAVFLVPSQGFPASRLITIGEDAPVSVIAKQLEERHVISSAFLFKASLRLLGRDDRVQPGLYLFQKPAGLLQVLYRVTTGAYGIEATRVTFVEGMSNREIAQLLLARFPDFDQTGFLRVASTSEGYLFPDTYFMTAAVSPEEVQTRLRARFEEKILEIEDEISASGRTLKELVIMASLLELEGKTPTERQAIAGVLYNRLEEDMPLQVDAVFGYIFGRSVYSPSTDDLLVDSPYNTYLYKGLPPGPIGNPGLESIKAAATPVASDYLYYLTGRDGVTYFARTFEEHRKNRELYLD